MTTRLSRALRVISEKVSEPEKPRYLRAAMELDRMVQSLAPDYYENSHAYRHARAIFCDYRKRPIGAIDVSWCNEA